MARFIEAILLDFLLPARLPLMNPQHGIFPFEFNGSRRSPDNEPLNLDVSKRRFIPHDSQYYTGFLNFSTKSGDGPAF
jgi:hypothetical protein